MGYIGQVPTAIPLTSADIADGTIALADMGTDSVDGTKIADDAINSEHYATGSIDTAHIATNQIDETLIKDAFVGDFSDVTVTAADAFLYGDATDSGNTKKDTIQGILDLASSSYRIGAVAFMNSTQTIATGTETKLEMDAERYDPNGDYNTSTYLYTVPSGHDGKYLVLGRAGCQALGDGKRLGLVIYINSAIKEYHYAGHSAASSAYVSCNGIFDLSASDTISLYGWHDKGSNGDWTGNADGYDTLFAVQRIA